MSLFRKPTATTVSAWGPVVLAVALMFVASSQPKVGPPPGGSTLYFSGVMPIFADFWDTLLKKSAHVLAYGALAALIHRGLRVSGVAPLRAARLALGLTLVHALLDEWHQSFVVGRHSSPLDVGLDLLGASIATGIIMLGRQRIKAPRLGREMTAGGDYGSR